MQSNECEETWTLDMTSGGGEAALVRSEHGIGVVNFSWGNFGDRTNQKGRAKLAAAAPEMARMLLRVEWCLAPGGCPACQNLMPYQHAPDCALDALLRKAGVR